MKIREDNGEGNREKNSQGLTQIVRGKNISKTGIALAIVIVISYNLYYLIKSGKIPTLEEQKSIVFLGGAIIVFLSPITASIILDKINTIFGRGNDVQRDI